MTPEKTTGVVRIIKATEYSMAGIKAAWKHEAAFRQELALLAILMPLGFFLGQNNIEQALLISSPLIVILTELINSALETVVDRIGLEYNPLAKRIKDMGSAAVLVSIAIVIIIWVLILI